MEGIQMAMDDDQGYPKLPSNRPSGSPTSGVPARQTSSELQYKARLAMPEAIEAVGRMLNAFPNARDGLRDGYMGVMAQLLTRYPRHIALRCAHPIDGVIRECKFLPTVSEAIKWLEREQASLKTAASWDQRAREQLDERERFEREEKAESTEHRAAVADRIRAELIAAGFQFRQDKPTPEQIDAWRRQFMQNHNITQEQYAALPNQPDKADYWQGVRWP